MPLTSRELASGFAAIAARMEVSAEELNRLDAEIGDGDLGVTMVRIGRGVGDVLDDLPDDVGMALTKCVQAITKVSGSSYATVVAIALMSAAKACKGRSEVPWSEMSALLAGACQATMERGKAALGDKTVIDALDACRQATAGLDEPAAIVAAMGRAVNEVLERMRPQPCRIGRARIFGDKTVGLDDPGMVAFRCMIEGIAGGK
ncbi:dihydroxyacetone kinase subunit L [Shumkonia mesophila]|uniref:dihydroxyacetone kinase subunit L n=1 Tax=Shumkonia mesophila TaxID=2838854 RepID=UPI0029341216|nr:DAK2 domain-containing protein [Shumkonia mesophila]